MRQWGGKERKKERSRRRMGGKEKRERRRGKMRGGGRRGRETLLASCHGSYHSFQLFVAGPCQLEYAGSTATKHVHNCIT